MANKSTGPRSAHGKARSSQNAVKHKILVGRILPEEKKQAALLLGAFQQELQSQGGLELEIVADIVLNRLQKHRIDKYAASEFEKSKTQRLVRWLERDECGGALYWLKQINSGRKFRGLDDRRLPPDVCLEILVGLKNRIEKHGLLPEDDVKLLNHAYGSQPTEHLALMLAKYKQAMQIDLDQSADDDQARKSARAELQQTILESVDVEIGRQQTQVTLKTALDSSDYADDVPAPPPAHILDLIERYNSANMREFKQLLDALKCVRKIKGDS
jgi:hypothetical protein